MKCRRWVAVVAVLLALGLSYVAVQAFYEEGDSVGVRHQVRSLGGLDGEEPVVEPGSADDFPCVEGGFVSCPLSQMPPYEPSPLSTECEYKEGDFARAWCFNWSGDIYYEGRSAAGPYSDVDFLQVTGAAIPQSHNPADDFPCVEGGFVSCPLSQIPPYEPSPLSTKCEYREGDFGRAWCFY